MNPQIQKALKPFVSRSMAIADTAIEGTRSLINASADICDAAVRPVQTLTKSGLRLNKISHNSIAKLVDHQSDMVKGALGATSKRLHVAANAASVKQLVDDQVKLMPASRKRLVGDVRETIEVLTEVRGDVTELVRDTLEEMQRQGKSAAAKGTKRARKTTGAAKKKATRAASTARKKVAKKTATAKRATRKVTAKPQ